jgi:cell division protein FtsI (penicillin-binding protein 3)
VPAGSAAHLVVAPDGSATLRGTPEPAPVPGEPQPGTGG